MYCIPTIAGSCGSAWNATSCPIPVARPGHVVVHDLNISWIKPFVHVTGASRQRLTSLANYARFFIPQLLANVTNTSLYLDCDTIVQGDVVALMDAWQWQPGMILGGIDYNSLFIHGRARALFYQLHQLRVKKWERSFNAGVVLLKHDTWLTTNATEEVLRWMQENAKYSLWTLGSQPPMQLVAHNRWQQLPSQWNFGGLAKPDVDAVEPSVIAQQAILHWSGHPHKPWLAEPHHFEVWVQHLFASPTAPVCACVQQEAAQRGHKDTPLSRYIAARLS